VRLTAKPVHFLHLNSFVAKTVHFKGHRFALHCKQSSALFLFWLRMTLPRIKQYRKLKKENASQFLN